MNKKITHTQYYLPGKDAVSLAAIDLAQRIRSLCSFNASKRCSYDSTRYASGGAEAITIDEMLYKSWGILCIGTDRVSGDSLGPMVGTRLVSRSVHFPVFGTLKEPVQAANLPALLTHIHRVYPCLRLIAIDAATGSKEQLGRVAISSAPICPGSGLGKKLPPAGDISIKGIIGVTERTSDLSLAYTRLYLVDTLADYITDCLIQGLKQM